MYKRQGRNGGTGLREPVGTALICDPYGFTERGTKALPPAAAKANAGGQSCPAQERKPTTTIGGDFLSINHIATEDLRRMEGKAVSYTHLDVYKRQDVPCDPGGRLSL